jgi:membrane associated rhomboid family serine protease
MQKEEKQKIVSSLVISGTFVVLMWLVYFLIWYFDFPKVKLATIPQEREGLLGILTSPWVHDDLGHLFGNSGPLFIFGAAILYFYRKSALKALTVIWLLTGTLVWVLAEPGTNIIGSSGIVYGLAGFLFFSGIFRREPISMALSLIIALIYGGMVWGVLPLKQDISWESHLFGAFTGIGMAWYYRKVDVPPRKRYRWEDEEDDEEADRNAYWNYPQNWQESQNYSIPGEQQPNDGYPE